MGTWPKVCVFVLRGFGQPVVSLLAKDITVLSTTSCSEKHVYLYLTVLNLRAGLTLKQSPEGFRGSLALKR